MKFQVLPPFCFTLSSFFRYSISNTSRAPNGNANASFLLAVSYRIPSGVATSRPSHDLPMLCLCTTATEALSRTSLNFSAIVVSPVSAISMVCARPSSP